MSTREIMQKATMYSETSACTTIVCRREDGNDVLLLAIATHYNYLYAKIVSEEIGWGCSSIFYNPCGLYVFAENVRELVGKLEENKNG